MAKDKKLSAKGKGLFALGMALASEHKFDDTTLSTYSSEKLEKELAERQVEDKHYFKCFKFTFTESIEWELMSRRGETP